MRYEKNNTVLPDSAIEFLNYCRINKGLSPATVNGYEIDLKLFVNYIKINKKQKNRNVKDIDIKKVDYKCLSNFIVYLVDELKNEPKTIKRKEATLRSYFDYLQNFKRMITYNPTYGLRTPKLSKKQPVYLTLEESQQLLESLDKSSKNYTRDYCIIVLFLNCGMRLSELASIKVNDIKEDILHIVGKGNKERTVYLNDICLKALSDYMKDRNDNNINDERLFPIEKITIEKMFKRKIAKTDIKNIEHLSVHKLRHTASTLMLKYGDVNIVELKELLGHCNLNTTMIYSHVDDEQLRKAVKSNPLNDILTKKGE
jgi:site-specific recombinase XerD